MYADGLSRNMIWLYQDLCMKKNQNERLKKLQTYIDGLSKKYKVTFMNQDMKPKDGLQAPAGTR